MNLIDADCAALVRAFLRRTPRRPPQAARASRDPMFRRAGSSFDLKNIREYAASDDPRRIDWRLEGRTGRLYVKEFYEEERDGIALLADLSSSLEVYGADEVRRIAASLAWMLGALGLPSFLMAFADRPLRFLDRPRGGASPAPIRTFFDAEGLELGGGTDIAGAVTAARKATRYRRLVLISDFFDPAFKPSTSPFSRSFFIRLYRPFSDLDPGRGEVDLQDPESGRRVRLPWDALAERGYAERERERESEFGEAIRRGSFYRSTRPGEPRRGLYWDFLEALYD